MALMARHLKKAAVPLLRPLRMLFTTAEEGEGNLAGIRGFVADHPRPPAGFVSLDLGSDSLCRSGVGSLRYRLTATAPGGHSWGDWGLHPSAIEMLMKALTELADLADPPGTEEACRLSFNIGEILGGDGINLLASTATATFEFRSLHPERLDDVRTRLSALLEDANRYAKALEATAIGFRPAAPPEAGNPLFRIAETAMHHVGIPPNERFLSTNINATLSAGWPSVVTGLYRCGNIHRKDEFILRDSLETGWRFLQALLVETEVVEPVLERGEA